MKQITCKSGLKGSQSRLRNRYDSLVEFQAYSDAYGLAARLGYKTAAAAWKANPVVQGSVEPSDFRKVKAKKQTTLNAETKSLLTEAARKGIHVRMKDVEQPIDDPQDGTSGQDRKSYSDDQDRESYEPSV